MTRNAKTERLLEVTRAIVRKEMELSSLRAEFDRLAGGAEFAPIADPSTFSNRAAAYAVRNGEKVPLKTRILDALLRNSGKAMSVPEIMADMGDVPYTLSRENVMRSTLHKMWRSGSVERPTIGRYKAPTPAEPLEPPQDPSIA